MSTVNNLGVDNARLMQLDDSNFKKTVDQSNKGMK